MRALLAAIGLVVSAEAHAAEAYLRSLAGVPWGSNTNEAAMDLAFGVGGWDALYFETASPGTLFSPSYTVIYLDGSDMGAQELQAFVTANQAAMEAWVAAGGGLFLNAAPNEGFNQLWGFGGVTLVYPSNAGSCLVVDPTHPAVVGPLTTALSFTGNSCAHAQVSGGGLAAVMSDPYGGTLIGEAGWGAGTVLFGGLTTSNWWTPTTEATNLRANLLTYLGSAVAPDLDGDGVLNASDNCPANANAGQQDADGDGAGDACDACDADPDNDLDADGVCGDVDVCPTTPDPAQADSDGDGAGDPCDPCPADAADDADADGLCANLDNCPGISNPGQVDSDADGQGDACEGLTTTPTGTGTGGTGTGTGGTATGATGTGTGGATGTGTGAVPGDYAKLGCGCASEGSGASWWAWALLAVVAGRRRHRP